MRKTICIIQEKFRNITYQFYRQADGIICSFDSTNDKSFKAVQTWMQSIYKVKNQDTPVVLTCNKIDLAEERIISTEMAQNCAD